MSKGKVTMDHHYAREKLTTLVRDLDQYTADEFWRQMSRIAAGATGTDHAEEIAKERDALAAHVERMTAWIKEHGWHADTCDLLDLDEEGKHKPCSCGLGLFNDSPETSLARRDLLKQAEALDVLADDIEQHGERPSAACVRYQAAELRRQADTAEIFDRIGASAEALIAEVEGQQP